MHCVYFPPEVGGLESHVYFLCRGLVERGHQVCVVTSHSIPETPPHEAMDGIQVWRTWFPARNAPGWALHALASIPKLRAVAEGADVLHAQAFASVVPCVAARRSTGAPLVTTFHTSHFLRRAQIPRWRPLLGWMVRAGDYNLAASRELASVAESLAPEVKVEALANGVDTERFQRTQSALPATARRRIIVPRRLFEKNGVETLVRALPLIAAQVDVEAVLIGDGPERGRLEEMVRAQGLQDRVVFLGARPHGEMPGLLSAGELAVFPSLMEATSVAALESMACELPVAASGVGGLLELVDDEVGGLFEPANPESLASTVIQLLAGPDLAARASHARQRVVVRWSNDRLVERHLAIYRELVKN